jgi:predicted ester cyclase
MTVEDEIVAGDVVAVRWTVTGTHRGQLPGLPPTGKSISLTGMSIARLRDGKFVESWNNWDALGMMQQLTSASGKAA